MRLLPYVVVITGMVVQFCEGVCYAVLTDARAFERFDYSPLRSICITQADTRRQPPGPAAFVVGECGLKSGTL